MDLESNIPAVQDDLGHVDASATGVTEAAAEVAIRLVRHDAGMVCDGNSCHPAEPATDHPE